MAKEGGVLPEEKKAKLLDAIRKMKADGVSEEKIKSVVESYKSKYGVKKKEDGSQPLEESLSQGTEPSATQVDPITPSPSQEVDESLLEEPTDPPKEIGKTKEKPFEISLSEDQYALPSEQRGETVLEGQEKKEQAEEYQEEYEKRGVKQFEKDIATTSLSREDETVSASTPEIEESGKVIDFTVQNLKETQDRLKQPGYLESLSEEDRRKELVKVQIQEEAVSENAKKIAQARVDSGDKYLGMSQDQKTKAVRRDKVFAQYDKEQKELLHEMKLDKKEGLPKLTLKEQESVGNILNDFKKSLEGVRDKDYDKYIANLGKTNKELLKDYLNENLYPKLRSDIKSKGGSYLWGDEIFGTFGMETPDILKQGTGKYSEIKGLEPGERDVNVGVDEIDASTKGALALMLAVQYDQDPMEYMDNPKSYAGGVSDFTSKAIYALEGVPEGLMGGLIKVGSLATGSDKTLEGYYIDKAVDDVTNISQNYAKVLNEIGLQVPKNVEEMSKTSRVEGYRSGLALTAEMMPEFALVTLATGGLGSVVQEAKIAKKFQDVYKGMVLLNKTTNNKTTKLLTGLATKAIDYTKNGLQYEAVAQLFDGGEGFASGVAGAGGTDLASLIFKGISMFPAFKGLKGGQVEKIARLFGAGVGETFEESAQTIQEILSKGGGFGDIKKQFSGDSGVDFLIMTMVMGSAMGSSNATRDQELGKEMLEYVNKHKNDLTKEQLEKFNEATGYNEMTKVLDEAGVIESKGKLGAKRNSTSKPTPAHGDKGKQTEVVKETKPTDTDTKEVSPKEAEVNEILSKEKISSKDLQRVSELEEEIEAETKEFEEANPELKEKIEKLKDEKASLYEETSKELADGESVTIKDERFDRDNEFVLEKGVWKQKVGGELVNIGKHRQKDITTEWIQENQAESQLSGIELQKKGQREAEIEEELSSALKEKSDLIANPIEVKEEVETPVTAKTESKVETKEETPTDTDTVEIDLVGYYSKVKKTESFSELIEIGNQLGVKVEEYNSDSPLQANFNGKNVTINKKYGEATQSVIAHEVLHGVLHKLTNNDYKNSNLNVRLDNFKNELFNHIDKVGLENLNLEPELEILWLDYIKKSTNQEIVTFAFTNPQFASFLSEITIEGEKTNNNTFWNRLQDVFIDVLKNIGVKTKYDELVDILNEEVSELEKPTDTDTEVVEEVKEEKPVAKKPVSKKKEAIESKSRKKKEVSPKKKSIEEKSRKKNDSKYEVKGFKDSEGKPLRFQKDNVSEVGKLEKQAKTKSQKKALGHIANVIKALVKIDPNISIDVHQSQDSYTQAVIDAGGTKADAKSSGFYEGKDGSIQINLDMVKENTVLHEATHKIMGSYLKKNPKAITKFKAQLDKAGMLSSSDRKSLNDFVSQYDNKQEQDEEFVTEWLARVANGDIELSKSRIQAVIDLLNDLMKKVGLDPKMIKLKGTEDVVDFAKKLSEAFTTGKEIQIKEDDVFSGELKVSVKPNKLQFSKVMDALKVEKIPTHPNAKVLKDFKLLDIDGQKVSSTLSDKLMTGVIGKHKLLGGIFYPQATGRFWAGGKRGSANKIVNDVKVSKDGYRYLVPAIMSDVSHMSNKNMSKIAVSLLREASLNREVKRDVLYKDLIGAFSKKNTKTHLKAIKKLLGSRPSKDKMLVVLEDYLLSDKMIFETRKEVVARLVGESGVGNPKYQTVGTFSDLARSLAEKKTKDLKLHQVVTVIRTKGNLTAVNTDKSDEFYHESYPWHIESDQEVELLVLDGAYDLTEIIPEFTTTTGTKYSTKDAIENRKEGYTEEQAKKNLGRTHGLSSYSDKIVAPKKPKFQKAEFSGSKGEKNFNKWKGDNKEYSGTDIQNIKTGEPVVVRAYHGTTNDFYEFDASVKGNVDGHLGAVNYFTSDIGDADQNYQTGGADLTSRIDQESEQLQYVIETEYTDSDTDTLNLENISEDFGVSKSELKGLNAEDIAHLVATKRLHGGTDRVLDVYVKLNNPAVIGLNQNWVEVIPESMYKEYMEDASEEIAEEYDVSVKEVDEDYSWEVKQRALEISGVENPLIEALQKAIDNNADYSSESAIEILEDFAYDEDVDLNQLESKVREGVGFAEGDRGMVGPQIVSDMFLNLGYDGIILRDVAQRFKNMGLGAGISHIHVFDENSNQIKLADGTNVDFNEDTKDIRFQKNKELSEDNQHAQDYINAIKEGDALNEYDAQEVYDNLVEDGWDVTLDEVTKMFDSALEGDVDTEVDTEVETETKGEKMYNNENIYTDKKGKREQITEPELTEEGKSYDKISQEKVREESTRILSENSVEVVEELAKDKKNDMHPALRQDLLTELAKYHKRNGDTDKAYELMDVDAEEGTTDAQALAMRAGRQNDPELETMQIVRKNTKAEREFKSQPSNEKGKTNGDVISDSYKELQDMATELGIKVGDSDSVDKLIEKIVAKKISELSNKGVSKSKAKIKKARNERANITKEFKKNKGKLFYSSVIPGMTPEGIVHFGKIAKTYINEGVANVELLVEKLKEYAKTEFDAEISDADLEKIKENYFSIEVKETISDYKKELKDIIKEHYSVQDARKRTLSKKIVDRLDLSTKEAEKIEKLVSDEFNKEAKAIAEKTLTNTYGKTNLPKKQSKKVKDDVDKLLEAVNMGGFNDSMYANLIGSKFGYNTLTQEDIDFIDEYSEMIQTMEEGELKNRKIQELQSKLNKIKDVTKSEKIGKILLEVFYTSVLSGPTTTARGLKGGSLTLFMNTLVSALAQPKASFGATMAMFKGMHRFGTSSWFQILKDGYSDVDHFEFKPSGEGVLDALTNTTFKEHFNAKDASKYEKGGKAVAKAFYQIPVRIYRMLIANDAIMKSGAREFNAYIDVYNRELLSGNKNKVSRGFFTNLNKELSIDKTSIKQAEVQADQEIEKLKSDGESITLGYRGRRIQEIINAKREMQYKGNADYALEKANEGLLMNDPIGSLGGIYRGIQSLTKIKEGKDDKFTIASRLLGKMMGFPFLKVASNFSNMAISYAPIVGTLQGVKRSVAGVRTKDGTRQLTPLEKREMFIKQAIGYTVTTALMMAIFDEDDDDNLVLSEDSWIQVSSNGPGSWAEGESVDPTYKRHSFRIRYSEGEYSDWYSYLDNPLGLVLAPIGILSDNVRFKQFKQRAKGNVEVSKVDKYDLLSPIHLPTFIGSQTYSQGLKNITTITQGVGDTSQDLEKVEDKLAGMVVRQAKGMVFPNIYKQMVQQTDAYLGTERKYIKGLDKVVEDVPLLEDIVEGSDYDKFGNPIIRDFEVALVPDFILDGLKKNRKYREEKKEWKIIYEFPEVNLGRVVKPPEDLTNKEKSNYKRVYGEIFKEEFLKGVEKLKRNKKYDALNVQILINRVQRVNTKKTKKAIAKKKK